MDTIVNKVAQSGIITLDLTGYLPDPASVAEFDLKPFLFREMLLREKDYREALKTHDWSVYTGKHTAVFCSADAIIPMWAYMLAGSYLQKHAASVFSGTPDALRAQLIRESVDTIDPELYRDARLVIKGCGDVTIPEAAYIAATARLQPVVKSLMYGEPCSTVPVYKQPVVKS